MVSHVEIVAALPVVAKAEQVLVGSRDQQPHAVSRRKAADFWTYWWHSGVAGR